MPFGHGERARDLGRRAKGDQHQRQDQGQHLQQDGQRDAGLFGWRPTFAGAKKEKHARLAVSAGTRRQRTTTFFSSRCTEYALSDAGA